MGFLISYVPSFQKSTCFLHAISVLSTMIMRDVLATIVMSAGEPLPVLAIYFKSRHVERRPVTLSAACGSGSPDAEILRCAQDDSQALRMTARTPLAA